MRIENEIKLDYSDVLIRPKRSDARSRKDVKLERTFRFKHSSIELDCLPIIASNMDGVGTVAMAEKLHHVYKALTFLTKSEYDIDARYPLNFGIPVGLNDIPTSTLKTINSRLMINLDVANGYTDMFAKHVREVRRTFPHAIISAGNVVTADQTQELISNGADIVKVGIGPGSVCTTRVKTGVGYPQLSAVIECADAAHGMGGHVIADGGCTSPGDVAKAFAAGADFVMLGGMLAGHDEGGGEAVSKVEPTGEWFVRQGGYGNEWHPNCSTKEYRKFYGMSSQTANDKHNGGLQKYRAAEGKEVMVPYRGSVVDTMDNILGGLRSACTYVGASKLKDLPKCTTFIRVNNQYNAVFGSS
jgi:GMP reductase